MCITIVGHKSVTRVVVRAMSSVVANARRIATITSHVLPSLHACRVQATGCVARPYRYYTFTLHILSCVCVCSRPRVFSDYAMCVTPQGDGGQASLGLWSRDLCRSSGTSHPWHCCIPRALAEALRRLLTASRLPNLVTRDYAILREIELRFRGAKAE